MLVFNDAEEHTNRSGLEIGQRILASPPAVSPRITADHDVIAVADALIRCRHRHPGRERLPHEGGAPNTLPFDTEALPSEERKITRKITSGHAGTALQCRNALSIS